MVSSSAGVSIKNSVWLNSEEKWVVLTPQPDLEEHLNSPISALRAYQDKAFELRYHPLNKDFPGNAPLVLLAITNGEDQPNLLLAKELLAARKRCSTRYLALCPTAEDLDAVLEVTELDGGLTTADWQTPARLRAFFGSELRISQKIAIATTGLMAETKRCEEMQSFNQNLEDLVRSHTQALENQNQVLEEQFSSSEAARRQLEVMGRELRRSEERWQLVLRGNNDGIWDWNIETDEAFLSARWKEMLGYAEHEFPNNQTAWRERIHPEDRDWVLATLEDHLAGNTENCDAEYRLRAKDGSYRWVHSRGQALWDKDGKAVRMVGSNSDVTERRKRKESIRWIVEGTANKTGELFFRACTQYLAKILDVRYALISQFANPERTRATTLAFWKGDGWGENFEYDLRSTIRDNRKLLSHNCYYSESTEALFYEDPELAKLNIQSYLGIPLTNSSGLVLGYLAVLDDKPFIKDPGKEQALKIFAARAGAELDRLLAELALQKQAEKDNLLSRISRQFIDRDVESATQFALQAITEFTGTGFGYILRYLDEECSCWRFTHEWLNKEHPSIKDTYQNVPATHYPYFHQQLVSGNIILLNSLADLPPTADVERREMAQFGTAAMLIVPMMNSGKTFGYIGLDADQPKQWTKEEVALLKIVGEFIAIAQCRQAAEDQLREAKEAADQANRAKSEFLASMSHELRTPLNAILGFSQVLGRDPQLTTEHQQHLTIINRSGEHLLSLINDILEMSKIEAGRTVVNPTNFDLHLLLDNLEAMLKLRAEAKGLQLVFDRGVDVPRYVSTDESKLRQVLINLLGNAIKFTKTGGVTLRSRHFKTVGSNRCLVQFEVEDTGPGIAPEELNRLFTAFGQTETGRKSQEGTGLGLAISQEFVQLLGGEIQVESEVGMGTLFRYEIEVELVEALTVPSTQPRRRVAHLAPGQRTYRILAVDDRLESRLLLVKLLSSLGFEVREASNGQEAIAVWSEWKPDLIWMDMRMPVMDGYTATQEIKRSLAGQATTIIALTASAFEEERASILAAGCNDFIRKPFREEVLLSKISEHLGVEFQYEDEVPPSLQPSVLDTPSVSEALAKQPLTWRQELQLAAEDCSDDYILGLVRDLPETETVLIAELRKLAQNYQFEQILTLLASVEEA
ncbi:MAG: PAS domain-containing protein [Cyanobacteria bacterium P01_H01_bin.15]